MTRPLATVVLPAATKARIVDDLDEFLGERTQEW